MYNLIIKLSEVDQKLCCVGKGYLKKPNPKTITFLVKNKQDSLFLQLDCKNTYKKYLWTKIGIDDYLNEQFNQNDYVNIKCSNFIDFDNLQDMDIFARKAIEVFDSTSNFVFDVCYEKIINNAQTIK